MFKDKMVKEDKWSLVSRRRCIKMLIRCGMKWLVKLKSGKELQKPT